jgi:hypothetical protein
MGHDRRFRDGGIAEFFELIGNGTNKATLHAPDALAADYDLELPDALPGSLSTVTLDATGKLSTTTSTGGTLDSSYDFGGAGAGRVITADSGPVESVGDGFQVSGTTCDYLYEPTGLVYNWRTHASAGGLFRIDRGDADADVSDDVFEVILCLEAANRRAALNILAPLDTLHIEESAAAACRIRLDTSTSGQDSSVAFFNNGVAQWEAGYDNGLAGFVIGRLTFANPTLFVEDTTGDVGINELDPDAKLHLTDTAQLLAVLERSGSTRGGIEMRDSTGVVLIESVQDRLEIFPGGSTLGMVINASQEVGINTGAGVPGGQLEVVCSDPQPCILIDQDAVNGSGLEIQCAATSQPLIDLKPVSGNSRGDIAFSTTRAAAPSSPSEGDLWYEAGDETFSIQLGGASERVICSNYGPNFGQLSLHSISSGVVTATRGFIRIAAEGAPTTDDLDTISPESSGSPKNGDTIILLADTGDTITVKHGTGNIALDGSADKVLTNNNMLMLVYFNAGTVWRQLTPMMVLP